MKYLELIQEYIHKLDPKVEADIKPCEDAIRIASVVFDEYMEEVPHNRQDLEWLLRKEIREHWGTT